MLTMHAASFRLPMVAAALAGVLVTLVPSTGLSAETKPTAPAEIWPAKVPDAVDAKVPADAATTLAPELAPAVHFQQTFLRILAGAPKDEWLPVMRTFAAARASDPVGTGLREVAKAWIARAAMDQISEVLDQYYVLNVRYPATLREIEHKLPSDAKTDPWGDPWAYQTHAPKGSPNQTEQSYQVGPKRCPTLGTLRAVTGSPKEMVLPGWKLTAKTVADKRALEFTADGKSLGTIVPGEKIAGYSLLYVDGDWALLAGVDQLFAVKF